MSCTECKKRAAHGPHYNPARGTGRTTRSLNRCLMAALSGQRVLFVTGLGAHSDILRDTARTLLTEALAETLVQRVTAERITFINGGWLEFKSMSSDLSYTGCREMFRPTMQEWDHYALEKKEEERRRKARISAQNTIASLMKEHGFTQAIHLNSRHDNRSTIEFC